jgi:tol-pal system protein YbgF
MTKVSSQDESVSDVRHARVRRSALAISAAISSTILMRGAAVIALSFGMYAPATAQQTPGSPQRPTATAQKSAPKAAPKTETPAPTANENTLRQRVEQLEEQLVEMQVTVGTLDSLSKGGGSSSSGVYRGGNDAAAGGGADPGKVATLETQVRALATQVDQLTQQIRQQNSRPQAVAAPIAAAPVGVPIASAPSAGGTDPIGALVGNANAGGSSVPAQSIPQAGASDASSKQAYETAYGYLLQQDFGAAETAFDDFLKRFPSDPLAGNAQYWLGETYFARGQYKPAAGAFLKGYQTYARSAKAPDSVLKLAMSLDKLGQKDAACASYSELTTKFPNAPGHVKNRADTERRRLGCA